MKQSILNDSTINTSNRKSRFVNGKSKSPSLLFNCGKRSLERKKKKNSKQRLILTHDEILTYEEVCYFHPRSNFKVKLFYKFNHEIFSNNCLIASHCSHWTGQYWSS